jgi:hypothetical protein
MPSAGRSAATDHLRRLLCIAAQGAERTSGLLDMVSADVAPKLRSAIRRRCVCRGRGVARILQIKPPATPILDALDAEIGFQGGGLS